MGQTATAETEDPLACIALQSSHQPDAQARAQSSSSRTADWIVRVIYFKPTDREPWPRMFEELDRAIRLLQLWLRQEMERLGYPNRTFEFEKQLDARLLVHTFNGAHDAAYYQTNPQDVWEEVDADPEYSDLSKEVQILIAHTPKVNPDGTLTQIYTPNGGRATGVAHKEGGRAVLDTSWIIPLEQYRFDDETPVARSFRFAAQDCGWYTSAPITVGSIDSENFGALLHEVLHAFTVWHDPSDGDTGLMGRGYRRIRTSLSPHGPPPNTKLSKCHASRLNVSPFLDPLLPTSDTFGPQVTILSPSPGQHFPAGAPITLRARIMDSGSGVGFAEFLTFGETLDCQELAAGSDVTVETMIKSLEAGTWTLVVEAQDRQGNPGVFQGGSRQIVVDPGPTGPNLVPFGVCHDPPIPRPTQMVRVVAGARNRGSLQSAVGALATWDRDVSSPPASGPGDAEAMLPSALPGQRVFVELGSYVYGGGQELSALRIDRSSSITELDETDNRDWPLRFGNWPYCHGSEGISGLRVSKGGGGSQLVLSWNATTDPCYVKYRVFESQTARPEIGTGQFPADPDFRDIAIDDLDMNAGNTTLTIPMPPGIRFYLVAGEGGTGHSGPVGHYNE